MTPKISLAMIVRDEEENLNNCLASVAHHVDEIVIVDTGSKDRTREVATRYGASIYQFDHRNHPEAFFLDDEATCKVFGAPPPYSGEMALGDFAAARNESFNRATGDFIMWVDADDVVEGGEFIRSMVDDIVARGLYFGFLGYDYARDHLGRVFYRQWRERVIRRGAAKWVNPVHEVLLPDRQIIPARYEQINISHRRKADRGGIPNRNYKILLRQLMQEKIANPDAKIDPRTLFYLGQEARWIEPVRAVGFYEAYLQTSGWAEERAAAHAALGQIYEMGMIPQIPAEVRLQRANTEYAAAAVEKPDNPDGLFGLARVAHLRERWQDCVNYCERGFSVGNTDSMLGANPMDRLYRPHIYYNYALSKLGRYEEALASCKKALEVCPDDPGVPGGSSGMIAFNVKFYEAQIAGAKSAPPLEGAAEMINFDKNEDVEASPAVGIPRDALVVWAMQLWKQVRGDVVKERALLTALPADVARDPVIVRMSESTARREANIVAAERAVDIRADFERVRQQPGNHSRVIQEKLGDLPSSYYRMPMPSPDGSSVVFWIGPAFEPWDATTPSTRGIGGSETACIEMAKNLAALGHRVTVYGDMPGKQARVDADVSYVHYETFTTIDCDVFISSRAPGIMAVRERIRAKVNLLWVHDIHVGAPSTPQLERWLRGFDRYLCLSKWHRDYFLSVYPFLDPTTVLVTRNGIDPARFQINPVAIEGAKLGVHITDAPLSKVNRLVFSSSPNRGLDTLLHNMQFVRQRVPDTHVDIFYGFDCWETLARQRNDTNELREIQRYKDAIRVAQEAGFATWHGRVNQTTLAQAFMRAKVWAYPTIFPETSCITAMEAQAAGCVPVTTNVAALGETVKHGILIDPNPDYGRQWVDAVVAMLTDEAKREPLARAGREWALANLSWASLAREWSEMFRAIETQLQASPLPMWKGEVRL